MEHLDCLLPMLQLQIGQTYSFRTELEIKVQYESFRDLQLCLRLSDKVKPNHRDPCYQTGFMHTACIHTVRLMLCLHDKSVKNRNKYKRIAKMFPGIL